MDNLGACLVKLTLSDPDGLKATDGGDDGATEPAAVFAVSWRVHVWNHGRGGQCLDLFLHALAHLLEHGATAGEHNILEQILADVLLALDNRTERMLVDSLVNVAHELKEPRIEEKLWALQTVLVDIDHVSSGQLVLLLLVWMERCLLGALHLRVVVKGHLAVLFLDLECNVIALLVELLFVLVRRVREVVNVVGASVRLSQVLLHELGQVLSADGDLGDCVGLRIALVDWDGVGDALTRVDNRTGRPSRSEQR